MTSKPLGYYTWIAVFRDGSVLHEFLEGHPQISFDIVAARDDVASVHLIPVYPGRSSIRIDVQPGEYVRKKWIRTFHLNLDNKSETKSPVIDSFYLISDKIPNHFCFEDGSILITTSDEP